MREGVELPRSGLRRRPHPESARSHRRQGGGRVPARELGRGGGAGRGRDPRGAGRPRRRVGPSLQLHGHPGRDPGRLDRQPADERDRRDRAGPDDLRQRRHRRHDGDPRPLARGRPGGMAARSLYRRLGLEPDVHGAAPLEEDPGGARGRCPPGGGGPIPQSHRARSRRAPAPAPGHRRGAGAGDDARGPRRGTDGRGLVPRPHRRLRRADRAPGGADRGGVRGDLRRRRGDDRTGGA